MSLPLGNAVVGYSCVRATGSFDGRPSAGAVALTVTAANLADLDFLPGLLLGIPDLYHRGPAHSLTGALLVAGLAGLAVRQLGVGLQGRRTFRIVLIAYLAHLALDVVSPDTHGVGGIPLFWPMSSGSVHLPVPLPGGMVEMLEFRRPPTTEGLLRALFSARFLGSTLLEGVLLSPVILLAIWLDVRSEKADRQG